MRLLIDMDGTICDWNTWFDNHVDDLFPELAERLPRAKDARDFDLFKGLGVEEAAALTHVFNHQGFYADIPPIEGAVEAVTEMYAAGHTVNFVTSPWYTNTTCMQDKADWILNYFGESGLNDLIITKDKTTIRGDFLIDDKPEVSGKQTPEWRHILFDQPYNRHIYKPRIKSWDNWEQVIKDWQYEMILGAYNGEDYRL